MLNNKSLVSNLQTPSRTLVEWDFPDLESGGSRLTIESPLATMLDKKGSNQFA